MRSSSSQVHSNTHVTTPPKLLASSRKALFPRGPVFSRRLSQQVQAKTTLQPYAYVEPEEPFKLYSTCHPGLEKAATAISQGRLVPQRRTWKLQSNARSSRGSCRVSTKAEVQTSTKVMLQTRSDCELAVSLYPMFTYNALGGGGSGTATPLGDNEWKVVFEPSTLVIPDLSFRTSSVLGIPIPPPINIAITPTKLQGTVNRLTGRVDLEFESEFLFTVGPLYKAPPLFVKTTLTTESSKGKMRSATGQRIAGTSIRLVGVAEIPKTEDLFVDTFLFLPTDALAILSGDIVFD